MAASKERTPSFVATIRLKTDEKAEKQLLMLSDCGRQLYNACLGESLKRLKAIQRTDLYKETIRLSKITETDIQKRRTNFKYLNETYGFTDASIQKFGIKTKNDSKFIAEHVGTHACQKIATPASKAVQKYAFLDTSLLQIALPFPMNPLLQLQQSYSGP